MFRLEASKWEIGSENEKLGRTKLGYYRLKTRSIVDRSKSRKSTLCWLNEFYQVIRLPCGGFGSLFKSSFPSF